MYQLRLLHRPLLADRQSLLRLPQLNIGGLQRKEVGGGGEEGKEGRKSTRGRGKGESRSEEKDALPKIYRVN